MCSLSASALDVKVDADCVEEDKTVVTAATLQEAGDIDWKLWNAVVPVDAGGGFSTVLGYKILRKANFEGKIRKFIKKNSNNTYELTGRFTGITEEGEFGANQGKFSASELVENYGKKGSAVKHWSNKGSHTLKSRLKVYKVNGVGTCLLYTSPSPRDRG